jgi:hypothetical protein
MTLLIGLVAASSIVIAIYSLRQWFLAFRPQTEFDSGSTTKQSGYKALMGTLFYLIILPLSYIELLLEMYLDQPKGSQQNSNLPINQRNLSQS